jgi:hypothetical protein
MTPEQYKRRYSEQQRGKIVRDSRGKAIKQEQAKRPEPSWDKTVRDTPLTMRDLAKQASFAGYGGLDALATVS